jgi:hypothetical protein
MKVAIVFSGQIRTPIHYRLLGNLLPEADVFYTAWKGSEEGDTIPSVDVKFFEQTYEDHVPTNQIEPIDQELKGLNKERNAQQIIAHCYALDYFNILEKYDIIIRCRWDLAWIRIPDANVIRNMIKLVYDTKRPLGIGCSCVEELDTNDNPDSWKPVVFDYDEITINDSPDRILGKQRFYKVKGITGSKKISNTMHTPSLPDWLIIHTNDMIDTNYVLNDYIPKTINDDSVLGAETLWANAIKNSDRSYQMDAPKNGLMIMKFFPIAQSSLI